MSDGGNDYRERASRLGGGAVVWSRTAGAGPQRVLPDGCTDLIWLDGRLLVAGPDTRAHLTGGPAGTRAVGLRFAPGAGPAVLGVPACELRDQRVPLAALWPEAEVRRLAERAFDVRNGQVGRVLEAAALDRLRGAEPADPVVGEVVAGLSGGRSVAEVAGAVGLGARQLHRRSLAAFGYGPKTLGRVLRLNRALELARGGVPFAEVAAVAGYADQAHLAREVRGLAGVPLGGLLEPA
ncbi:AraC family transcriptional regulator [Streptomyces himastatinicus ATCC 53653]|uniref:AraC family transcriptional regulator n=1 Tax=Streptomyces himastatinicus ATCC 53653 TaxID=457427 RepID=D9WGB3_9ACTN|nr:helix-turn-helix domain-containing protein [Streptomyces himastatinicus]EFL23329.1 AraC family transcriptional regulator [Streptomyces himastatinicus ATCC 53653]